MKYFTILFTFHILIILNSKVYAQLYSDDNKIVKKELSEYGYTELISFLSKFSSAKLQDTIILKYDFNYESCWDLLDYQSKKYIKKVISSHQEFIEKSKTNRPSVSIFEFREKGNNINKLIKWNKSKIIDSTKRLYNLLIYEKSTCGSSAIILPDRNVIVIRSDAHFIALNYKKELIEKIILRR